MEVDFTAGRTIIEDELRRDIDPHQIAVDWGRHALYVTDSEEPNGIMVFSLDTGEWIRTIATPRGEGPNEFPYRRRQMDISPTGGLYVSAYLSVVEFDLAGNPVGTWGFDSPPTMSVCNFGGAPAVPTQGGVVRRGRDSKDEGLGPIRADGRFVSFEEDESAETTTLRVARARIACAEDRAYVVMSYDVGPDSVFVYHRDGTEDMIVLPSEDDDPSLRMLNPSLDGRGNLVLFGLGSRFHGVIINPSSGCHTMVRNRTKLHYVPMRVHADSVLVFHSHVSERRVDGQIVHSYRATAKGVSMRPLRRVSGDPCSGMLDEGR